MTRYIAPTTPLPVAVPGTGWFDPSSGVSVLPSPPAVIRDALGDDYITDADAWFNGSARPGAITDASGKTTTVSFASASYGTFIPIVFSTDRIKGNVFWASPVRKYEVPGSPGTYYEVVDFALGLCEGAIDGVIRVWLDDKVIYSALMDTDGSGVVQPSETGYVTSTTIDVTDPDTPLRAMPSDARQTKLTVFDGSEDQIPAGIMMETEGYENSPGYRGLAYILFENFVLTKTNVSSMTVEVAGNTTSAYPRLKATLPSPKTRYDTVNSTNLLVDGTYDRVYVRASDVAGDGTIPFSHGIAVFDYNTLEFIDEFDVKTTLDPDGTASDAYHLFPQSGKILDHRSDGNAGYVHVINSFSTTIEDSLGPAGGLSGHNVPLGFSPISSGSCCFVSKLPNGLDGDVLCGIGSVNKSIGFAWIDDNGQLTMQSTLNAVLTKTVFKAKPMRGLANNTHTTFSDGGAVAGTHVYIFQAATSETVEFKVTRVTVEDATGSLLTDPVLTEVGTIDLTQFSGAGFVHALEDVFYCPTDGTFILLISVASGTRNSFIAKYNPYTHAVDWATEVAPFTGTRPQAYNATLSGASYAWITSTAVYSIDLSSGDVKTVVPSLSAVSLPAISGAAQFYNGTENSILYVSTDSSQYLVKIFVDRLSRGTVSLDAIVSNLLERVGLLRTDMNVADLVALSVLGYSITEKRSLRALIGDLAQVFLFDVIESNGRVTFKTRGDAAIETVDHHYLSATSDEGWLEVRASLDIAKMRKINLTYKDIDREYADNVQSVTLPPFQGTNTVFDNDGAIDVRVPLVMTTDDAKRLAEIMLFAKLTYGTLYGGLLPTRFAAYNPGDVVTLELNADATDTVDVRLRTVKFNTDNGVEFEAAEDNAAIYTDTVNLFSALGTYTDSGFAAADYRIDPWVLNIPYRTEDERTQYDGLRLMYVAFLNVHPTAVIDTRPRVIMNYKTAYYIEEPITFPTWGYVTMALSDTASPYSTDSTSVMRVKMISTSGATLASSTHDDVLASDQVNLAWVGGELVQFTTVSALGDDVYEFSGFMRAKLGTEFAVPYHVKGERFILLANNLGVLDTTGVKLVALPSAEPQTNLVRVLVGSNNPKQVIRTQVYTSLNAAPWSVADLSAAYNTSGDGVITWNFRYPSDGEWADDGSEAAVVQEPVELYVVYLYTDPLTFDPNNASTYLARYEKSVPNLTYDAATQTTHGFDRTTTDLYITVSQEGAASNDGGVASTIILSKV